MIEATRARIAGHWSRRFGAPVPGPFPITVGATGRYADGALVVVLDGRAHVDAPLDHLDAVVALTEGRDPTDLLDPAFWTPLASAPVLGPADRYWADHSWTDHAAALGDPAPEIPLERLAELRPLVTEREWLEAGFASNPILAHGFEHDGRLVAAAVLTALWGWPADVGVLVAPDARGEGLGSRVAVSALTAAVSVAGFGCYRVERGNAASVAVARHLRLEPYGANVLVPLAP
ncbi:GNAT family N-acetyltransferase [Propioniciclava sp.]|uniref:GNAT family N-acetyltransferase n=1 Tax=Propioniciclava sp. TaxID=2038686 RepID=UPI0026201074|nr:GNAT family N-acetyltransferase [Propioniciclava sp.]